MVTLVMYVSCDDARLEDRVLYYVDINKGAYRIGGSALAQVYNQMSNVSPAAKTLLVQLAIKGQPRLDGIVRARPSGSV